MKLPEFRTAQDQTAASRSTSMASAFMTPQLRPMTERHKAAQHNLNIKARNPEEEQRLAIAKYAAPVALAGAVGELAQVVNKIDDSAQKMATEKAAAEYKYGMAEFSAQEMLRGNEIDPETNQARHYGYEERYNAKKKELTATILENNRFSNAEYVHKFGLQVQGVDFVNTDNLRDSSQRHKIEKGKADYVSAINSTTSTAKKIELTDLAVEAGFITAAKGEENKYTYKVQGSFDTRSEIIDNDNSGLESRKLISDLKTDEGELSVGGKENANKLIQKAVEHLGLVYADNAFGEMSVTGSTETLQRKLAEYSRMTPEQLGVDTLEEKDALIGVMETKFADAKRVIFKKSEESEKARRLNASFQKYNENNTFATVTLPDGSIVPSEIKPQQGSYSPTNQKDYNEYIKVHSEAGMKLEEMFEHEANYAAGKFTWVEEGVIPKDVITANIRQLDHSEPSQRYRGARQINRILNDQDIPDFLQKQILKEVGKENAGYAAAIAGSGGSTNAIEMLKEGRSQKISKEDGIANYVAWSKDWVPGESLATKLTELGLDPSGLNPAAENAFQLLTKYIVEEGTYGNGKDAFNASQNDAVGRFLLEWGQDNRGGELTWVRGSFNKQAGGDTEAQARVISNRLIEGGYPDLDPNKVFAEQSPSNPESYYLRYKREDGSTQTLYDKRNAMQAMTISAEELRNTGVEVRKQQLSAQKGREFMNVVDGDNASVRGLGIPALFEESGLKDWMIKDYKASINIVKEVTRYMLGMTQTDFVTQKVKDIAADMVGINPQLAQQTPIEYLVHSVNTGQKFKPESKEANDIIWTRLINHYRASSIESNKKKKRWSPQQIEDNIMNIETELLRLGLERPQ